MRGAVGPVAIESGLIGVLLERNAGGIVCGRHRGGSLDWGAASVYGADVNNNPFGTVSCVAFRIFPRDEVGLGCGRDDLHFGRFSRIFLNADGLSQRFEWSQYIRIKIREGLDIFPGEQFVVSRCDPTHGEAAVSAASCRLE